MQHRLILSVIFSLLLVACASAPQNTPSPVVATNIPYPMDTPAVAEPIIITASQPETIPTDPPPAPEVTPPELASTGSTEYQIDASESSASYEVGETLFSQNNRFNVAVGVTSVISGSIQVDPENLLNTTLGVITVDISQLKSDSDRRDRTIQDRFLESLRFPIATFTPTRITGLPESYTPGDMLTFQVTGDLTVHDVTKPATFEVQTALNEGILRGLAETSILMSDFGVGPIQIAGIVGTEDEVKLSINFVARQAE